MRFNYPTHYVVKTEAAIYRSFSSEFSKTLQNSEKNSDGEVSF